MPLEKTAGTPLKGLKEYQWKIRKSTTGRTRKYLLTDRRTTNNKAEEGIPLKGLKGHHYKSQGSASAEGIPLERH